MLQIDLNLDAGEDPVALANGAEAALYDFVTSVNIACGGHAGDEVSMAQAVRLAKAKGLSIGAHPSFPDRSGFGRQKMTLPPAELTQALAQQIRTLKKICSDEGAELIHVKPHGALYNLASSDENLAKTIFAAVCDIDSRLAIVGLAGSAFLDRGRKLGLRMLAEAFADRRYEADGQLRARSYPDALITDPATAAAQALQIASGKGVTAVDGRVLQLHADTICVHGDTPGAMAVAQAVSRILQTGPSNWR